MFSPRPFVLILGLCVAGFLRAEPVVTTLTDSDGSTATVRTPAAAPEPGKTYWLLVSVHGVGASGRVAAAWFDGLTLPDDVILLAPTFTSPKERGPDSWRQSYQMAGPAHVAKLDALVAELERVWPLHPRLIVNGFSAGAQFAHRYAFLHPERVAGVAAHSGGSWASVEGEGANRINLAALAIPFAVSCGEEDRGSGGGKRTRIDGTRAFAAELRAAGFTVDLQTWPGLAHEFGPGAKAQTLALVEQVRAGAGAAGAPAPVAPAPSASLDPGP